MSLHTISREKLGWTTLELHAMQHIIDAYPGHIFRKFVGSGKSELRNAGGGSMIWNIFYGFVVEEWGEKPCRISNCGTIIPVGAELLP